VKIISILVAAVFALSAPVAIPAQAATAPVSVHILTARATAYGDVYYDDTAHETRVSKPHYTIRMRARCPAGRSAFITVPVYSMTAPGVAFTCTGRRQTVSFGYAAASDQFGWHWTTPTVHLEWTGDLTVRATDTRRIHVYTSRHDLYPDS
jgi:hypothetical protein